jgi:uncharacterized protein YjiS (DUF1127 family)
MTDIPTLPQPLSLSSTPAGVLRFPAALVKYLFRPRRENRLDLCHTSEHRLKDIGISRAPSERPRVVSLDRLW